MTEETKLLLKNLGVTTKEANRITSMYIEEYDKAGGLYFCGTGLKRMMRRQNYAVCQVAKKTVHTKGVVLAITRTVRCKQQTALSRVLSLMSKRKNSEARM